MYTLVQGVSSQCFLYISFPRNEVHIQGLSVFEEEKYGIKDGKHQHSETSLPSLLKEQIC